MERPRTLNASFVQSVRRPGRYGDGRGGYGLSLLVKPTSTGRTSKTWAQRLYINGRAVNLGLGGVPAGYVEGGQGQGVRQSPNTGAGDGPQERRHGLTHPDTVVFVP